MTAKCPPTLNPRLPLRLLIATIMALLGSGNVAAPVAMAQSLGGGPEMTPAVQHDVSRPLRDMPSRLPRAGQHEIPLKLVPRADLAGRAPDGALQTSVSSPLVETTVGLNIPGVGTGDYGFTPDAAPPDTNGAVGATQYVQWVNESFAVFNKADGSIVPGFPKRGNTLWSGFGGGCELNNDGDPIVQYDKAARRWVMTQFSVSTLPYLECVAVSTTSDATGSYYRYAFSYGNTQFPDYPKLAVWPDAYYITFNVFNNGSTFAGAKACAYDRAAMLVGGMATQVCFQLSTSYGSLLPSDLDGTTPPPAGSPNYLLNFGSNSLRMWKFHVDFATPSNSALTGPTAIPVASFSPACGGRTCIPQPGTSQQLDSLGDRLMYRFAYRNFGDHESLVVNHSVSVSGSVGVRWYELRNPGGAPVIFQQGTYAPDSDFRWMGSIAMDKLGDVAVGYSVSSSSTFPSIRYTGRLSSDPLGALQSENTLMAGGGSQTSTLSRWGDYSAISIDPLDDCTFWYTNEYLKSSGTFNWSTRIGSFKFPSCASNTQPPTVSGVTPNQGPTAGGTSISIAGTNFTGATGVTVGGVAATSFTVNSDTSITATTPAHTAGTVDVTVTTPSGTSAISVADRFTYVQQQPIVMLNPTSLDFGSQLVGTTSPPQNVTLTNTGNAALDITAIGITGDTDFNETDNCPRDPVMLGAGASCVLTVTFSPTVAGPGNARLSITDNAQGSPQQVNLSGLGTAPAVTLNPGSLDFGNVPAGATSSPQTVQLTNSGTAPLNIFGIASDNPDFNESDNCPVSPTTLAPGANCVLSVTVTPSTGGAETGNVVISDDALDTPQTVPLTVNGGAQPARPAGATRRRP